MPRLREVRTSALARRLATRLANRIAQTVELYLCTTLFSGHRAVAYHSRQLDAYNVTCLRRNLPKSAVKTGCNHRARGDEDTFPIVGHALTG